MYGWTADTMNGMRWWSTRIAFQWKNFSGKMLSQNSMSNERGKKCHDFCQFIQSGVRVLHFNAPNIQQKSEHPNLRVVHKHEQFIKSSCLVQIAGKHCMKFEYDIFCSFYSAISNIRNFGLFNISNEIRMKLKNGTQI